MILLVVLVLMCNICHVFVFKFQSTLSRLGVYRVTVSHTFLYKKLDEYGHNHNAAILGRDILPRKMKFMMLKVKILYTTLHQIWEGKLCLTILTLSKMCII